MPTSPVPGVAAFFGAYIPSRWRQVAGYVPHHEAFLWPAGKDPLEEVVRRASDIAQKLHYNGVLITEVRCEPRDDGWQIAYDAMLLLLDVEPEETQPEVLSLFTRGGAVGAPAIAYTSVYPMMDIEDYTG